MALTPFQEMTDAVEHPWLGDDVLRIAWHVTLLDHIQES
eukprot:CAMPEP_0169412646 /NCGR_PEP_ID=MMETSP1017-20121227/60932_1 /TAXON_ID=342587 /ORGANISM="Karlodinium micrum, Strain CCMP2283" /LENGTH=38 /DNA_ID= /DNA_START= /DNA_END= /DNA_ORIENTATION=